MNHPSRRWVLAVIVIVIVGLDIRPTMTMTITARTQRRDGWFMSDPRAYGTPCTPRTVLATRCAGTVGTRIDMSEARRANGSGRGMIDTTGSRGKMSGHG